MSKLTPKIGLRAATILVVSVIVGSGVFKKIAPMSAELGSPILVLLCWILAGFISLAGALSTAEMASMFPDSGGEYNYFQKIYGRFFAFLYGWGNFTVMKTASIAALAYIFAQSFNSLIPLPSSTITFTIFGFNIFENLSIKILASGLVIFLSFVNFRGISVAESLSNKLTHIMFGSVLVFIVIGLFSTKGNIINLTQNSNDFTKIPLSGFSLVKGMMIASLGAFWGYEGWNHIGYIGEEIKEPQNNLPLALSFGTIIVIIIYVSLNLLFLYILPIDYFIQLNNTPNKIAAIEVANQLMGEKGMIFIACLILVTTLNATNSSIMMSARIFYAMSRDGLFFKKASSIHSVYKTPDFSLLIQAIWSILLIWSGTFDQLTDMLVFASFIYYGSTALGVIIMRIKFPNIERKYKVIAYPILPIFFVTFCVLLFIITIYNQPKEALLGLGLIGTGIPFYLFWRK
ncbi:amino acid permease-associated region [Emticicia oligotrophica DSM 17448]|uniref:Amino acid permease-associated region n=1 Tax=Emticicia oligotrophica (strain DSM 17448 / CIP 109782 / MTCC 6937 / GPTSA100-15) TaxID=929562 RepID=A0ABM5N791_EMTOG|nr:amino acid permease [Emticicia oligotrophica]AFK05394.1 amino acid permease-associated region [Emticicia oligotrophica DSM 17448]